MGEPKPVPIIPSPGVVKTDAARVVQGRWINTEKARFVRGLPQKIGGWTKKNAVATDGVPRSLHAWRDLSQIEYIAAGTYRKLYILDAQFALNDITPYRATGDLTDPFTTTDGSSIVTVAHTGHGENAGDLVFYSGADSVGGLDLNGSFRVLTIVDTGHYTIDAGTNATSDDTGGGTVAYKYEAHVGTEYGVYGLGFGVGGYGLGTYGTPRASSTIFIEPRHWSLDHFGQVLLAAFNGGTLYAWDPSTPSALQNRAEAVSGAPTDIRYMFNTSERIVIALCDDLRIDWCDQGDYSTWAPTETNLARSRRVGIGTKLVAGAVLTDFVNLIWTDAALYQHQFDGSQLVYQTLLKGEHCGLISPSAQVVAGGTAYWMGHDTFFLYNGAVQVIPNVEDIREYVFKNLRTDRSFHCCAMYNAKFDEVWFFYITTDQTEPGFYVIYSPNQQRWAAGALERVAGTAFQHGDTRPYWGGADGFIYLHEDGHDADGAAMHMLLELGPVSMGEGSDILQVDGFEPDFKEQSGDVTLTMKGWDRLRDSGPVDTETYNIAETDSLVDTYVAGRYMGLVIESNTLGGYLRFGKPVALTTSIGKRR